MTRFYFYILGLALATSISQILLNIANKIQYNNRLREYINPYVISSYIILMMVLLGNTYIMKYIKLMTAHALASSTYIFTMILSGVILKEKITMKKVIGNILIILGVIIFVCK